MIQMLYISNLQFIEKLMFAQKERRYGLVLDHVFLS